MARFVVFNGSVIIRPGAATKIDASQYEDVQLGGNGIVALVGEADYGPPRTIMAFIGGAKAVQSVFGSGDIVEAANIVANPANDERVPAGAQKIIVYKINNSTQSSLVKSPHTFKSQIYGLQANSITMALAEGTTTIGRVLTIQAIDPQGNQTTEVSPSLGENAKLTIAYVGAGSACSLTISATQLTTSVTGGPGGENLSITFADYRSLLEIVAYINSLAAYTCTALITNVGSFDPTYLDALAAVPIIARSGAAASTGAGAAAGQLRLTGLTGMLATDVGQYLTISGAASAGNNGTFKIAAYNNATSVDIYNATAVQPDGNDGSIAWTTGSYYVYATNFDLLDWVNQQSSVVVDDTDSYTKGAVGPIAIFSETGFSGGTRGTSTNADWVNAFAALQTTRINQLVALVSDDATASQGTFTFDSIAAALAASMRTRSSTAGRSECQGWIGTKRTKDELITLAQSMNSAHVVVTGQELLLLKVATSSIEWLPAWSYACALAGMRGGAPLGEPITKKRVNCFGVRQDASWSNEDDGHVGDLTLNGVTVCGVNRDRGVTYVNDKVVTTYTASDNDAFIQETVVQIWKHFSYDMRRAIEERFVGRGSDLSKINSVPGVVNTVGNQYRDNKAITDSVRDGTTLNAWRNVTASFSGGALAVGVTISPTESIDYALITTSLVPPVIEV